MWLGHPIWGSPNRQLRVLLGDGTVIIWTVAKEGDQWEGKVLKDFKTPVWRVSWSLTGNILAVADGDNNVTLWKEADRRRMATSDDASLPTPVLCVGTLAHFSSHPGDDVKGLAS
ncbi:hypothetical protein Scep_013581 [Stephania cephalantha]|uniref:Uncharacterized protein n=1 Tax=Stephania cephalantha TaxID=152367 RepID=A0AAP0JHB7_9MAGN